MYKQNSSRDLFLSQPWSQVDSQDWNTQDLNRHIPSTPSGHVLPPTPSTSGIQTSASVNNWPGRSSSQITQPAMSQVTATPGRFSKESIFSRQIRFVLHALLSVVKDLPEKLKEVVLKSSENRTSFDEAFYQNVRQIVNEQVSQLEKVISNADNNEAFFHDNKKSQECLHSEMEEFGKRLSSHGAELENLRGIFGQKTDTIKKQMNTLRKLYITESNKLKTLLVDIKRDESDATGKESIESTLRELLKLTKASKDCNEELFQTLQEKGQDEILTLSNITQDIAMIKVCLRDLPTVIRASIRTALNESNLPIQKQNVRIASWNPDRVSPFASKSTTISPVARVVPQVKETPTKFFPSQKCTKITPNENTLRLKQSLPKLITYSTSSDDSPNQTPTQMKLKERNSTEKCYSRYSRQIFPEAPHNVALDRSNLNMYGGRKRRFDSVLVNPLPDAAESFGKEKRVTEFERDVVHFTRPLSRPRTYM